MTLIAPGARLIPVKNTANDTHQMIGLCLHVQVGNGSLVGEFNNPVSQASSTWWVGKDGRLEQYATDPRVRMWAQGAGNAVMASIETEGTPDEPLTDAQCATIARILAWANQRPELGWPLVLADHPGQPGFGWHGMGCAPHYAGADQWGNHPSCPGDVRLAQRQHILDLATRILHPDNRVTITTRERDTLYGLSVLGYGDKTHADDLWILNPGLRLGTGTRPDRTHDLGTYLPAGQSFTFKNPTRKVAR